MKLLLDICTSCCYYIYDFMIFMCSPNFDLFIMLLLLLILCFCPFLCFYFCFLSFFPTIWIQAWVRTDHS
jgi:hypothetical protein